jgi:quinol monooxygenase YgiN
MSIHLLVAFLGGIVAAAGTVMLAIRFCRAPRIVLAAWALAALGLAVSLGAQALGYHGTFGPGTFRAMQLSAQVLAPLALCLGLAEVAGRTLAARFAARLLLPALALIAFVVLGSDPLSGTAFSVAWPAPSVYYQIIPNKLLEFGLGPVTALVAVLAIGWTAVRSRRDPAWRPAEAPVWAAGVAALALALPAMSVPLSSAAGLTVPVSSLFVLFCLVAAALTWFAGMRISRVQLGPLHDGALAADEDNWDQQESWASRYDEAGGFESPVLSDTQGVYRGNGLYRGGSGYDQGDAYPGNDGYGSYDASESDVGYHRGEYGGAHDTEYPAGFGETDLTARLSSGENGCDVPAPPVGTGAPGRTASWLPGRSAERAAEPGAAPLAADGHARERLFGQLAIYTLSEGSADEFDQQTEQVVGKVRAGEPDTLVYIVHAVPSAPMQRILYEVYRDRAAYEQHKQQPYIGRFEADRGPLVLATNVIELGLQQAKVSPFPSIADLFGEPGYDTSGFERPDYRGTDYGRPPAGPGDAPGAMG